MPTKIEWTNETWNPITGCSIESPGCTNCYAMKLAGGRLKNHASRRGLTVSTKAGPVWTGEVRFNRAWLRKPLFWRRARKIFVCAHADLFHPDVPDEWIDGIWAVMALAPRHHYQVLTKRAERMRRYLGDPEQPRRVAEMVAAHGDGLPLGHTIQARKELARGPLPQIWCGVSIEDAKRMEERGPDLVLTAAAVRFWSVEPLLSDLGSIPFHLLPDWVIVGGESGPRARPFELAWGESIVRQCQAADVPVFVKQLGAKLHPKSYKDFDSFPPALQVRQFPPGALIDG